MVPDMCLGCRFFEQECLPVGVLYSPDETGGCANMREEEGNGTV
jgi:hypothetical protein